jgi:hypothetical protein
MGNAIELQQRKSYSTRTHFGIKEHRVFFVLINGVRVFEFNEGSPFVAYAYGPEFDKWLREWLEPFERALSCKTTVVLRKEKGESS